MLNKHQLCLLSWESWVGLSKTAPGPWRSGAIVRWLAHTSRQGTWSGKNPALRLYLSEKGPKGKAEPQSLGIWRAGRGLGKGAQGGRGRGASEGRKGPPGRGKGSDTPKKETTQAWLGPGSHAALILVTLVPKHHARLKPLWGFLRREAVKNHSCRPARPGPGTLLMHRNLSFLGTQVSSERTRLQALPPASRSPSFREHAPWEPPCPPCPILTPECSHASVYFPRLFSVSVNGIPSNGSPGHWVI